MARLRAGGSLAETLIGMALAGLVAAAALSLLLTAMRTSTTVADGAEFLDAVTVAAMLLPAELRALYGDDLRGRSADSIAVRAFRGLATVCARDAHGPIVRFAGFRDPDPAKDSLLVVTRHPERAAAIKAATRATAPCAIQPEETLLALQVQPDSLRPGEVALLFETGSYHLATHALRYRPGTATRQPLTAEVFATDSSAFSALGRVTSTGPALAALSATLRARARAPRTGAGSPLRHGAFLRNADAALDSISP